MVKVLLDSEAELAARTQDGRTVLDFALEEERPDVGAFFEQEGSAP